jgi:hypothetical protein
MHSLTRRPILLMLAVSLLLAGGAVWSAVTEADVGIESVSPRAGQPGQHVVLTVGCGACRSAAIVNGPAHPPADFPIFLIPAAQAPRIVPCPGSSSGLCAPSSVGPPSGDPFVPLGRAKPTFRERDLARTPMPRYRLRFRIPEVEPGSYTLVIYCGSCYRGPRGSLIAYPQDPGWRLRVLQPSAIWTSSSAATRSGGSPAWSRPGRISRSPVDSRFPPGSRSLG